MITKRLLSGLLAVAVFVPLDAHALPSRDLTLEELVTSAQLIAVVRIEQSAGEWQEGRILTRHEATVEQRWSGRADERVEISTLGGFVGDIGQRVSGQVDLRPGERLVVFLVWDAASQSHRLRGGSNGVYRILDVGGVSRVRGDLVPSPLIDDALPGLEALERQVREVLRDF